MDAVEIEYSNILLNSLLEGLKASRKLNVFGPNVDPFLVIWISDSKHKIMKESVSQLNSSHVSNEVKAAFDW
jgi:hypothetical protein